MSLNFNIQLLINMPIKCHFREPGREPAWWPQSLFERPGVGIATPTNHQKDSPMLNRSSFIAGLLIATVSSAALAQTTTNDGSTLPSASEPSNNTVEPTAPATEPSVKSEPVVPSNEPAATQAETNTNANAVTADGAYEKRQGDMRASDLIGKRVYNDANEDIGEIDELVVNSDGRVAAVIVGVGGFLGMGERKVAVPFSSLKMQSPADGGELRWTTDMTRDRLVNAPEWKWTVAQ